MHPFSPQQIASSGLSGAGGIDQGAYGDCVFEASMAAVATTSTGQATISQMISQNPDGSYAVTFPGNAQSPATVTQANITALGVTDSATWADVLEAAVVVSNPEFANGGAFPANAAGTPDGSPPTPAQYALHLLTGNPATRDVANSTNIGTEISQALASGQPVIACCPSNDDNGALVSGHEWTVISCNPRGNQITVRNPWGNWHTAGTTGPAGSGVTYDGNGEATMSLQTFGTYYVAHLLRSVAGERRAEPAPAIHDDFRVHVRNHFLDVALQHALAEMPRLGGVARAPLGIFAHVQQHHLGILQATPAPGRWRFLGRAFWRRSTIFRKPGE